MSNTKKSYSRKKALYNEPETKTPKAEKQKRKKLLLKILITVLIILAFLSVTVFVLGFMNKNKDSEPVKQVQDYYLTKNFRNYFPVDFDADLTKDAEYMALNRQVMYTDPSGYTMSISDIPQTNKHEGHLFFERYFDIAISGRYEEYPSLFTQSYTDNPIGFENNPQREFPPQRIYNISVSELIRTFNDTKSYTYEKQPCEYGIYDVTFRLMKNDGLFRRDLAEDSVRTVRFELVTLNAGTDSETTLIKNLYTLDSIQTQTQQ